MALNSTNSTDLEVLQRKLQRLLWLCRTLNRSEMFGVLCFHLGQDGKTVLELEPEFMRLLALVNAASILNTSILSPAEIKSHAAWTDFHLQALEDIHAAILFFHDFPPGQAAHVA